MSEAPKGSPDFNSAWWELSKSARQAQIEYGRWIINTLWLMNSGAIAGLLLHWKGDDPLPHKASIAWFISGILFGFTAAMLTWLNFSIADMLFRKWTYAGDNWHSVDVNNLWTGLSITSIAAIACVAASMGSMLTGAILAL